MPADNVVGGSVLMPEEADETSAVPAGAIPAGTLPVLRGKHRGWDRGRLVRLFSSLLPPPSIPRQKTGASRIVHLDLSCLIVII